MVQFIDLSIGLYIFVICKIHLQEVKAWHPYNPVSYHHKARLSNSVILFLDNYSWNKLHAQYPHLDVRILIGVTIPTIYGPVRHKKKKKMMMMR